MAVISIIIKSLVCVTLNTGVIILNKVSLLGCVWSVDAKRTKKSMPIVVKRRGEIQFTQFRTQRGSIPELNRSMTNRIPTSEVDLSDGRYWIATFEIGHIVRTENWMWRNVAS